MKKPFSLVIPTYNESKNLSELLNRLSSSVSRDYEVIIVDDNSPDRTWRVAQKLSSIYPLKVIRRKNGKDLSSAVTKGMEKAENEIVAVMDADLQHPPEMVPELVDRVNEGVGIAVGSRFVEGGGVVANFGIIRKVISSFASVLARLFLKEARPIKDIQSGFFALRKKVIRGVDINPVGYKILLEILIKGHYHSFAEVGYKFGERRNGNSKLGVSEIIDYLRHLVRLVTWKETHASIRKKIKLNKEIFRSARNTYHPPVQCGRNLKNFSPLKLLR